MRKITGIEIVLIIVAIIFLALAPIDAYRISSVFRGMAMEQSYIYETNLMGVLLTLLLMYLVILVKYYNQRYQRAFIIVRLFPTILLCLYNIGYLFGLSIDSMRGVDSAFEYNFFVSWWLFGIINIVFMGFNVILFGKVYKSDKYKMAVNIYAVVLVIFYLVLFSAIITDSAVHLGLFEWD